LVFGGSGGHVLIVIGIVIHGFQWLNSLRASLASRRALIHSYTSMANKTNDQTAKIDRNMIISLVSSS
jgi:hypothetical protein